jgi:HPt (histidine-containing phosphotransfer) domain-containing protein
MLTPRQPCCAPVGQDGRPPAGAAAGAAGAEAVLDPAALAGLRELDPTGKNHLLERVLAAFKTSTARLIPQLQEAHRHADLQGMRHVAHTLKSSSASVGGMKLSGICAELESGIRQGQTGDQTPLVEALVEEVDKLLAALQRLSEGGR